MDFLRIFKRPPDVVIGGKVAPYLLRWHLLPRNRFVNLYLHEFRRSDDDRALHDHPWTSVSILFRGEYVEHLPGGTRQHWRAPAIIYRPATHAHRLALVGCDWPGCEDPNHAGVMGQNYPRTLFLTGPRVREWGFLCPQGWRHWRVFTSGLDPRTGESRGCAS